MKDSQKTSNNICNHNKPTIKTQNVKFHEKKNKYAIYKRSTSNTCKY